ncbi:LolA family protein [Sphingomonas hankyongi]|uniref:Outer membrane lipoprotein carrier protein LolA n=1 Tax=Sphingomonas hankyongi TaxID=2908209 RepID=A0ABT0S517_9SPHN|nr:outer membrane lipoprotein carrier protein LolA [Sphingomonas hankyongi]MCL6730936.1 outer membrane lipoprotein carrier protein LolA [Sphingomonas hankyongi]
MSFSSSFARATFAVAVIAAAAPAPAAESADLAKLAAHISAVQTMTANFVQTDQRGRAAAGKIQMKRPGRVRFEYGSGDLLLVANGKTLSYLDYQVGQKSSWPLSRTPLGVLLSGSPNLRGRAQVVPGNDPRVVVIKARDPAQYGSLLLAFVRSPSAPGGLQLHGWTAIDAQNKRTTVRLSNVRYNVAVPDSAFTYAEPKKRR